MCNAQCFEPAVMDVYEKLLFSLELGAKASFIRD
jgi:hypothetical protein